MAETSFTGEQWDHFHEAILSAFVSYDDLKPPFRYAFGIRLNEIATANAPLRQQVTQLIDWAETNDKVRELVSALRSRSGNPGNLKLKAFEASLSAVDGRDALLEKLVSRNPSTLQNTEDWRQAMIRAEASVCRVEAPERTPWGTGFLIGPDLLVTNQHVRRDGSFDANSDQVRFRFDYRTRSDGRVEGGQLVKLAKEWDVGTYDPTTKKRTAVASPVHALDYVIVRLAERVGEAPSGSFLNAPIRGWVVTSATDVSIGQSLYILQHPKGDTVKTAEGGLKRRDGAWLEYDVDTDEGSSGSPVFNNRWELVALHSRAGQEQVNKGVAFSAILADLGDEFKRLELSAPPAGGSA